MQTWVVLTMLGAVAIPRGVGGESPFVSLTSLDELKERMQRQAKTIPIRKVTGVMVETRWFEHVD